MVLRATNRIVILWLCVCVQNGWGQTAKVTAMEPGPEYTLGAGDELNVSIGDTEELQDAFANSFLIDSDGDITVPMIGRVHAADLTIIQLQSQIRDGLMKYVRDPQVYVSIKTLKSQPVSVLGAVNTPGVYQIGGPKTLVEVLAVAGGLGKDAGYQINITRQRKWGIIPLPTAAWDSTGQFSTAQVNTKQLTEANDPTDNILIKPNDVITVPRSEVVYAIGQVHKPGGFTLGERKRVSVLEVLSLAEGLTTTASEGNAKIIKAPVGNAARVQVKIDLRKVLRGESDDIELAASDILFVPDNSRKRVGVRTLEVALQTISGVIIFRGF
jgi:polysaccharide biosynthesis/export protein